MCILKKILKIKMTKKNNDIIKVTKIKLKSYGRIRLIKINTKTRHRLNIINPIKTHTHIYNFITDIFYQPISLLIN